jgi:hypothetical protein
MASLNEIALSADDAISAAREHLDFLSALSMPTIYS